MYVRDVLGRNGLSLDVGWPRGFGDRIATGHYRRTNNSVGAPPLPE